MSRYPTPGVRLVIRSCDGRVLLKRHGESWDLPGGRFEGGKDWNTVVTECLASLGASSGAAKLTGIYTAMEPEPSVIAVFLAEGSLPTSGASVAEWVSCEALPDAMPTFAREGILDALRFRGQVFSR